MFHRTVYSHHERVFLHVFGHVRFRVSSTRAHEKNPVGDVDEVWSVAVTIFILGHWVTFEVHVRTPLGPDSRSDYFMPRS